MPTYLVTGATSGLGLQVAHRLAKRDDVRLILPVRDADRGAAIQATLRRAGAVSVETPAMDLGRLQSVAKFVQAFHAHSGQRLDGLALNAGVQCARRLALTDDGFERTFAVNHLANLLLLQGLLDRVARHAAVVWTSSGTHDPTELSARLSGFRGARYSDAARVAKGDFGPGMGAAQACRDAYATSKLCNIVTARWFAEWRSQQANFFAFDPGLMPGTGLARERGVTVRWVWNRLLPRLAPVLPGTSTPAKSAGVLADMLTGEWPDVPNGAYVNYTGKSLDPAPLASERWIAEDLMQFSDAALAPFFAGVG